MNSTAKVAFSIDGLTLQPVYLCISDSVSLSPTINIGPAPPRAQYETDTQLQPIFSWHRFTPTLSPHVGSSLQRMHCMQVLSYSVIIFP